MLKLALSIPYDVQFHSVFPVTFLFISGAWCSGISDGNQYLQIDFGMMKIITKIGVQGRPQINNYVSSYKLFHSTNLVNWTSSSKV